MVPLVVVTWQHEWVKKRNTKVKGYHVDSLYSSTRKFPTTKGNGVFLYRDIHNTYCLERFSPGMFIDRKDCLQSPRLLEIQFHRAANMRDKFWRIFPDG